MLCWFLPTLCLSSGNETFGVKCLAYLTGAVRPISIVCGHRVFHCSSKFLFSLEVLTFRLFKEGLIYRDKCCVNWCCHLQSTVSDLEVETMMLDRPTVISVPGYQNPLQFGAMHEFAFKLCQPVGKWLRRISSYFCSVLCFDANKCSGIVYYTAAAGQSPTPIFC